MCLLLISYNSHPLYKLIIAANRDEFYNRPTEKARFWDSAPFLLGGKDLQAGGTWLGITKRGRFAAITNYREPQNVKKDSPSRGKLVTSFLENNTSLENFVKFLYSTVEEYNGYNLLYMEAGEVFYFSNKAGNNILLSPGIYALSNHLLDTPWPKVEKSKRSFIDIIKKNDISIDAIFNLLSDGSLPPDELLPNTGIGLEIERAVSPIFVSTPHYGTRSSTVILIDKLNNVTFVEKALNTSKTDWEFSSYHFLME
jgi:uncharacterized protein with NRDE domain